MNADGEILKHFDPNSFDEMLSSSATSKLRRRRILEKNAISYVTDFVVYLVYIGKILSATSLRANVLFVSVLRFGICGLWSEKVFDFAVRH